MRHAFVVPLIGGQAIAQAMALDSKPDFIQSYSDFAANDAHLRAWWPDVPFVVLDVDAPMRYVGNLDVVGSTCPCAGLSTLSTTSGASSAVNDWMLLAAEHVLRELKPRVYWGENAPNLSSQMGWPIAAQLCALGREFNYSFSMYKTKSELHGLPQIRQRTFYFFWRDRAPNEVPVLPWVERRVSIEDWFKTKRPADSTSNIFIRSKKPSEFPIYRFLLERDNVDHATFVSRLKRTTPVPYYLLKHKLFNELIGWLNARGFKKEEEQASNWRDRYYRQSAPWERYLILPRKVIGAYVSHYLYDLVHSFEDRFLNVREMLNMMGLPKDFTLLEPKKNIWHITQNVPVQTAFDAAMFIKQYLNDELEITSYRDKDAWLVFDNVRHGVYSWPTRK